MLKNAKKALTKYGKSYIILDIEKKEGDNLCQMKKK